MIPLLQVSTPEEALNWCSIATSFKEFKERTLQSTKTIDLSVISSSAVPMTTGTVDGSVVDWR